MFSAKAHEDNCLFVLRWTARVLGITSVAVLSLFLFGEGSFSSVTLKESIGLLFFPFGLIIGLGLAWWKELIGGVIAVGSAVGFYFIYEMLINSSWPKGPWFAVFAIPGVLFLIYGILAIVRNSGCSGRVKV